MVRSYTLLDSFKNAFTWIYLNSELVGFLSSWSLYLELVFLVNPLLPLNQFKIYAPDLFYHVS